MPRFAPTVAIALLAFLASACSTTRVNAPASPLAEAPAKPVSATSRTATAVSKLMVQAGELKTLARFYGAYLGAYFHKPGWVEGSDGAIASRDDASFFNRAGQRFGFPAINPWNPFDLYRLDQVGLIGDLTRVTLEATADAFTPTVIADAKATGCTKGLLKNCVAATEPRAEQLQCVMGYADRMEASTGQVAAQVARSRWLFGVNDALARSLQVVASVGSRKLAETSAMDAGICPPM